MQYNIHRDAVSISEDTEDGVAVAYKHNDSDQIYLSYAYDNCLKSIAPLDLCNMLLDIKVFIDNFSKSRHNHGLRLPVYFLGSNFNLDHFFDTKYLRKNIITTVMDYQRDNCKWLNEYNKWLEEYEQFNRHTQTGAD